MRKQILRALMLAGYVALLAGALSLIGTEPHPPDTSLEFHPMSHR